MLQMIAISMTSLGAHAMFYLAAAVSDFYVPWTSMVWFNILSSHLLYSILLAIFGIQKK